MPRVSAHALSKPLTYSGPLSTRMICGRTAPFDDLVQAADDTHGGQREVHFNAQALTVVIIQHIEGPELSPIRQLILHEVHRPRMVGSLRHRQFIRLGSFQPFARPDTQVQLQLAVDPVHALVVPFIAFDVAQIQKAQPKAPRLAIGRQTHQPIRDLSVLIVELALIAIARLADLKRAARQRDADRLALDCVHGHLASLRWPYRFFPRASFSKSFCMLISAYIRFRAAVLIRHRLHLRHHRRIHAAKLRTPFVKARAAHPMLSAKLRNRHTALRLLQNTHDLRVAKSSVLHQKSPQISCRENSTFEHH